MEELFQQFIQERKYLKGISPRTEYSYHNTRRSLFHLHGADFDVKALSKAKLNEWVVGMRQKGLSPGACNVYIRTANAFLNWLHLEHGHVKLKVAKIKEEQKIIQTLTAQHIAAIVGFRPSGAESARTHLAALTMLDCGLRASELLRLTKETVDFDNLVFRVAGKGGKHRLVPFSPELRKGLWKFQQRTGGQRYIFGTKNNTTVSVRNLERDFKVLGKRLGITGIRFSPHTFRHTFAVSYLRNGGNLFYLSKILGHRSIKTTERYLQSLGIEDLQAVHSKFSLLSAGR